MSDKKTKNILFDWKTIEGQPNLRVRGRAMIAQPEISVARGDYLITSPIIRIYTVKDPSGDTRFLETKNSLYILIDD